MLDAILIARSGLMDASHRLDAAARAIAGGTNSPPAPPRDGGPVTGAVAAPSAEIGDPAGALLDLMTAEMSYRLNLEVIKTAADMARSLYEIID